MSVPTDAELPADNGSPSAGGWAIRWTGRLAGTVLVVVIGVLVTGGLSLAPVPVQVMFACVVTLIVFSHIWWAASTGCRLNGRHVAWRFIWALYSLAMLMPIALFLTGRRDLWDHLSPGLGMRWVMVWYGMMVVMAPLSVAVAVLATILGKRRAGRSRPACSAAGFSRRALLQRGVAAFPFVVTAAAVGRSTYQSGRFKVRRISMKLDRLPDRLRGLTITHVSDWHVGRLFTPAHLPAMVEAANGLKSDLVAVTGDLVDHSIEFLPDACEALAQLEHRYGRFTVIGNHDLIDSPQLFVEQMAMREPGLLVDRHVRLAIGGETISLAGLFWSWSHGPSGRDPGYAARAAAALAGADRDRFTIALAHHPHAFDALAERGVDLTLAGHTHGGQIMLTPPGRSLRLGAGGMLFRYIWGEYRKGTSALYVNAGVGDWFPIRVNAPAEIVQIQLV